MRSENLKKQKNIHLFLLLLFTLYCLLLTDAYALDVKREVLDNGLTLMTVERHNLPMVVVTVGIKAGSVLDPPDKAGLSNLTTALLRSGTINRTAEQIDKEIEFVGGELESSGRYDYITVSLTILKKDISLGFALLSDIILNPVFPVEEIEKKIRLIKGNLRASEDDPNFVASKTFIKEVFDGHPYGRLIQGTEESLGRISREGIVNFHKSYYLPDNTIISIVGDVTTEEAESFITKYFKGWRGLSAVTVAIPSPPAKKEGRTIIIDKDLKQANIILGHTGVARNNPDYYAISVMNYILGGGGFASRLMQRIREEKGLVYDIYSTFSARRYGGSFEISLQTKNASAYEAIGEILKEIKRMREEPVSDTELEDAKSFLTGVFPVRIETGKRIANFLVAVEYYGLGIDYIERYPEYINRVTKEDILKVAKKYIMPDDLIIVIVGDRGKLKETNHDQMTNDQ